METAAFRIAQEALWNVDKHAAATRVEVALALSDGQLRLRVKDNGRGFGDRRRSGDLLSGGAGLGTEIVAELPLPAPTA